MRLGLNRDQLRSPREARAVSSSREALRGEWGGEQRRSWLVNDIGAPSLLQSLERRGHLFAGSVAARPQAQLPLACAFQHRQLDPQLCDRCARLPFLDPRADEAEQLCRAAQRMSHDGLALFRLRRLKPQPHAYVLRARAAQTHLFGKVAAQRARDEQHRFAIFDWLVELSMRAREKRWAPGGELVGLETSREQDRMPSIAAELALQLARADRGHCSQRAKTQEIQAFELLRVERELARRKRREEGLRLVDLYEASWSRARRGKPGGERSRRETESRLPARGRQSPGASLSNRFSWFDDSAHVQPRNTLDADLDRRRKVVESGRDELSQV